MILGNVNAAAKGIVRTKLHTKTPVTDIIIFRKYRNINSLTIFI